MQDDNCVLAIVRAISDKAMTESDATYLAPLNSICDVADGYIAEYMLEVGEIQFSRNLNELLLYLGRVGDR